MRGCLRWCLLRCWVGLCIRLVTRQTEGDRHGGILGVEEEEEEVVVVLEEEDGDQGMILPRRIPGRSRPQVDNKVGVQVSGAVWRVVLQRDIWLGTEIEIMTGEGMIVVGVAIPGIRVQLLLDRRGARLRDQVVGARRGLKVLDLDLLVVDNIYL